MTPKLGVRETGSRPFIADGYTAKLEAGYKCLGPISLAAVLGALNVALVLVKLDEHGRPLVDGGELAA